MKIFTIGFTKKTAVQFFSLLDRPDLKSVVDIRLNNNSQLAGFTKTSDLRFFLRKVIDKDYTYIPELAPTNDMLKKFRESNTNWSDYERDFLALMKERQVEATLPMSILDGGCLLCSEATPEQCHRNLVANYLAEHWPNVEICHLL